MRVVDMYRNGKVVKVLEVSKDELMELKEKYPFISISEADMEKMESVDGDEIVGVVAGEISLINVPDVDRTPDCWFIYGPERHGYKRLDSGFRGDFGDAIRLMKKGYKVAREGWNGKIMWLIYVPGSICEECREGSPYERAGLKSAVIGGHIDIYTTQGTIQPGWTASQADMLAEDWMIVD